MSLRLTLLVAVLAAGTFAFGCTVRPDIRDEFDGPNAGWAGGTTGEKVLWYIPNRIVDLLDIVHFGAALGPGIGLEGQATRGAYAGAAYGWNIGLAWMGRYADPYREGRYQAWDAGDRTEVLERQERTWHTPYYDIGLTAHFLLLTGDLAFAPDEFADFFGGIITWDWKADDWPLKETAEEDAPKDDEVTEGQ